MLTGMNLHASSSGPTMQQSGASLPNQFGGLNAATMNLALGLAGSAAGGPSQLVAQHQNSNLNAQLVAAQQQLVLPPGAHFGCFGLGDAHATRRA